jgi:plasmid maintenance system antidote protein VapI
MARRSGSTDYESAFGLVLQEQLAKSSVKQSDLSRAANVSPSHISRLMTGSKVSPEWADLIADVLKLAPPDRIRLHTAAAKTWGFKLDLTTPS